MSKAMWIWYYGDFEIYHNMNLSLDRTERGATVPVFWTVYDCNRAVRFRKMVNILKEEAISVIADGEAIISLDGERNNKKTLLIPKGEHEIQIVVYNKSGIPAVFVEGDTIKSDETWQADNTLTFYGGKFKDVGFWNLYNKEEKPTDYKLPSKNVNFETLSENEREKVFDFGKETFIRLYVKDSNIGNKIKIYCGESLEEVNSDEECVIQRELIINGKEQELPACACRYIRIAGEFNGDVKAYYEYLPKEFKGDIKTDCGLINDIYDVSKYTYDLTSRLFFLDGIKRDKWVWAGDAFQSSLFDYYSCFDKDVIKRTLIALRGNRSLEHHINGIVDYTLLWIITIGIYLLYTDDKKFIEDNYENIISVIEFCIGSENDMGFLETREDIWTFVDWADMEKGGALCAIQILYAKALKYAGEFAGIAGDFKRQSTMIKKALGLKDKIMNIFWNEEEGGFVTTFDNGAKSEQIRRHANIFAIIFDFADEKIKDKIINNVLLNDSIPQITTPYFKLYELEAFCKTGNFELVLNRIKEYWGGMLDMGATSFWEEFDKNKSYEKNLEMYEHPFDKSLCHAWGAGPLYILGRYFAGIYPVKNGFKKFVVKPELGGLKFLCASIPVNNGSVYIEIEDNYIYAKSSISGGELMYRGKKYILEKGKAVILNDK